MVNLYDKVYTGSFDDLLDSIFEGTLPEREFNKNKVSTKKEDLKKPNVKNKLSKSDDYYIYKNDKNVIIEINAIGLSAKDIKASYTDGVFTVEYEENKIDKETMTNVYPKARGYNKFDIDSNYVDINKINISVKNGILRIEFPYKQVEKKTVKFTVN